MGSKAISRASIALVIWLLVALAAGFLMREDIGRVFGPDTWWMVAGWVGLVIGLIHFLTTLVLTRKPASL